MKSSSLVQSLREMQRAQYRHDQIAHQDIAGLPVPRRVTHFTLHFSKYVGRLAKAIRAQDEVHVNRLVTDSFVIALAAANAMNVDLHRRLQQGEARAFTNELVQLRDAQSVLLRYAEVVGEMAKGAEALDHMEDYPSRKVQEAGVIAIISIAQRLAEIYGMDLSTAAHDRWRGIEQKSLAGREEMVEGTSPLSKAA